MHDTDGSIKHLLKDRKLAPKKAFGQNFLVHRQTAERIAGFAAIGPGDTVVEVGVGLGALTLPLASRAGQVIGIEVDAGIVRYHEEQRDLPDNVSLVHRDVLRADFAELAQRAGGRLKILANLPYSISNPFLFRLLENQEHMDWAVLMLQKEVAERLYAPVGSKAYGVLTVLLAAAAAVTPLMDLGPGQFHPRPKVDSQVVRITFRPVPEKVAQLPEHDPQLLRRVVSAAFQQRRKTLVNTLAANGVPSHDKEEVRRLLEALGINPGLRGETLSTLDFVRIARAVESEEKG